jgi:uncharacterized protein (TIGR02588 family)
MSGEEHEDSASEHEGKADWLEKLATAVAGLLLAGIVGFLIWDGFHDNTPAAITAVSAGTGETRGESWYVPVTVENAGDEAVRDVAIRVESTANGQKVDGEFELDWLPGRSRREGVAVLPKAAVGQPVKAMVKGYVIP